MENQLNKKLIWDFEEFNSLPLALQYYFKEHGIGKAEFEQYIKDGIKSGLVTEEGYAIVVQLDHDDENVLYFDEDYFIDYVGDEEVQGEPRLYHGEGDSPTEMITAKERIDNDWKEFAFDFIMSHLDKCMYGNF